MIDYFLCGYSIKLMIDYYYNYILAFITLYIVITVCIKKLRLTHSVAIVPSNSQPGTDKSKRISILRIVIGESIGATE